LPGKEYQPILKAADALVKKYGGSRDEWQKVSGKVRSNRYDFDVHWYQIGENTYEYKVKSFKERGPKDT